MAAAYRVAPVELECSICLELLKEPTKLTCTHSFCKECLRGLYQNQSKDDIVDCPLCRRITVLENGDFSDLKPNMVLKTAVDEFREKLRSLEDRAESRVMALIEDVTLVNKVEDTVHRCHQERIGDIEKTLEEKLVELTKRMHDLMEVCKQEESAQMATLNEMRESKMYVICGISGACDVVRNGSNALMEGAALTEHERACRHLEEILEGSCDGDELVKAIERRAEDLKFIPKKGSKNLDLGELDCVQRRNIGDATEGVTLEDYSLPSEKVMGVAITLEGAVAVGYRTGGIEISMARGPTDRILQNVNVWGLAITSKGNFVVRDMDNNVSIYSRDSEKLDVTFNTLDWVEGGLGDMTISDDDTIFISYWKPEIIQAFTLEGGYPIAEIRCDGYVPYHICTMRGSRQLVVADGCTVLATDEDGEVTHVVTEPGLVACPAVIDGGIVFIAWVDDQEGLVSIGMYSSDLTHMREVVRDVSVEKGRPCRCFLRTLANGNLAFIKGSRLYIFSVPISSICSFL
ncbi:uncharacterized protein [Diadema antillarum]|uniref:uncharacterized protein n=1 Tax=Diadema antillarum TaxID=105358 RepID=UPI003A8A6F0B